MALVWGRVPVWRQGKECAKGTEPKCKPESKCAQLSSWCALGAACGNTTPQVSCCGHQETNATNATYYSC